MHLIRFQKINGRFVQSLIRNAFLFSVISLFLFLLFNFLSTSVSASGISSNEIIVQVNISADRHLIGRIDAGTKGTDALSALKSFAAISGLTVETRDTAFGPYVVAVGGVAEKQVTAASGWGFWVNGKSPEMGADQTFLKAGDMVSWSLYDYAQTLYPVIAVANNSGKVTVPANGEELIVTVQASKTTYDENWNASTSVIPVSGATVEMTQGDQSIKRQTDANGKIVYQVKGNLPVKIVASQYDAKTGLPLLVPSKPVWMPVKNAISFTDVPSSHWAYPCIQRAAANGWFLDSSDAKFYPSASVNRKDALQSLAIFMKAQPLTEWYSESVALGLSNDRTGKLSAQPFTRGQLAIVLHRLLNRSLPLSGSLPVIQTNLPQLKDQKSIKNYAVQAVIDVRSRGLMNSGSDGKFAPDRAVTRAELAHILRVLDDAMNKK